MQNNVVERSNDGVNIMLMLYKITIFLVVITIIYYFFVGQYVSSNLLEQIRLCAPNYTPIYSIIGGVLILIDAILIIVSLFHFLFM